MRRIRAPRSAQRLSTKKLTFHNPLKEKALAPKECPLSDNVGGTPPPKSCLPGAWAPHDAILLGRAHWRCSRPARAYLKEGGRPIPKKHGIDLNELHGRKKNKEAKGEGTIKGEGKAKKPQTLDAATAK